MNRRRSNFKEEHSGTRTRMISRATSWSRHPQLRPCFLLRHTHTRSYICCIHEMTKWAKKQPFGNEHTYGNSIDSDWGMKMQFYPLFPSLHTHHPTACQIGRSWICYRSSYSDWFCIAYILPVALTRRLPLQALANWIHETFSPQKGTWIFWHRINDPSTQRTR